MKKIYALVCLLSMTSLAYSQAWSTYKLDENVTIEVPSNVEKTNYQGQDIYSSQASSGACFFLVSPPSEIFNARNRSEVNKTYSEVSRGFIDGAHAQLIDSSVVYNGNLEGKGIRAHVMINGQKIISETHFYMLSGQMYQFQFMQAENLYDSLDSEQSHFFNSVKFVRNPEAEMQFSKSNGPAVKNTGYKMGYLLGQLMVYGILFLFLGGGIIAIVVVVAKNRKSHK